MTVVFADLEGFTTLAEQRDPETVKELLDGCFDRLVPIIESHGGHVDKVIGDELMAVFGAPVAHEDDAQRAVHAALALGPTLAELDESLRLRVGVNTGEVLAGAVGPVSGYTVTGDAVNIAHRLAAAAGPGEVLVGDRTRQAAPVGVAYESRGQLDLKGKTDPVVAWVARTPQHRAAPRLRAATPLVGRSEELAELRGLVEATVAGGPPQVVTLIGEAGIGKTRLARELVAAVREDRPEVRTLWVSCPPYRAEGDVGPLAELVRIGLGVDVTLDREAIRGARRAVDEVAQTTRTDPAFLRVQLGALLGLEAPEPTTADAPRGSAAAAAPVFAAARSVVEHLARRRPLLIVVDDANWAGPALLRFLALLPEHLPDVALVVLVVGRDDLLERRSARALGGPNRSTRSLDLLSPADLGELVKNLLDGFSPGPSRIGPAALERLVEAAEGIPLLAEQLVRFLVESEGLVLVDDRWQWTSDADGNEAALPDGVRSLIGARLDALPAIERQVLSSGAVIGRQFWRAAVRSALAIEPAGLDDAVDQLVVRGLLEVRDDDGFGDLAFRHVLTRDVAYASLPIADRAGRHAQVARWLEGRAPQLDEAALLSQLAHHYERAITLAREVDHTAPGLAEAAFDALVRAARMERRREGLHRADHWYRRARQLGTFERARMAQVAAEHGEVLLGLRQLEAAEAVFEQLQDLAGPHQPDLLVLALARLGAVARLQGDVDGARERFDRAATLAAEHQDVTGQVDVLRLQGWSEITAGRPRAAVPRLERALALLGELPEPGRRGEVLRLLGWCELLAGEIVDAQEHLWEAMRQASAAGDIGSVGWSFGLLAESMLFTGRASQALEVSQRLQESAIRHLDVSGEWTCSLLSGAALVALGDPQGARALASDAASRFEELDEPWGLTMARVVQAQAARAAGDLNAARGTLREGIAAIRDLPHVGEDARLLAELARVESEAGDLPAAERHARAARSLVRAGIGDHESGLRAALVLAEVELAGGSAEAAELLLEEAAAERRPGDRTDAWRQAAVALGGLRLAAGDRRGARELLGSITDPPTEDLRTLASIDRLAEAVEAADAAAL